VVVEEAGSGFVVLGVSKQRSPISDGHDKVDQRKSLVSDGFDKCQLAAAPSISADDRLLPKDARTAVTRP